MINENQKRIEVFLNNVDRSFPTPISQKQDLHLYAKKLCYKATLCIKKNNQKEIVSLVAGYTENVSDNIAFISLVATLKSEQHKGLAKKLINEFISICKEKGLYAVNLYTDRSNFAAIKMYESIGFTEWKLDYEPRPNDLHFIYYI